MLRQAEALVGHAGDYFVGGCDRKQENNLWGLLMTGDITEQKN